MFSAFMTTRSAPSRKHRTLALLTTTAALFFAACGDDKAPGPDVDVTCNSDCLDLGATSCSGDGFRTCELDANGCLTWGPVASCPGTTTCSLGACSDTCQDECATADVPVCEGNSVRTCGQFDSDSCLDLGDTTPCPTGGSCSNGVCASTCADECPEGGATECVGAGVRTCGNHDGDSCLEWSAVVACANTDNACELSTCQAGACAVVPAADGTACSAGPCMAGLCEAGSCEGATGGCGPGETCVDDVCSCATVVNATTGIVTTPLLVEAVDVVLTLRLSGQPAPTNLPDTEVGQIRIRHRHSTEWLDMGIVGRPTISEPWRLIPGEYDVEYKKGPQHSGRDGILTPENPETVFTRVTIPKTGGSVAIDIPTAQVSFQPRINGQPAPTNLPTTEQGQLYIRHEGSSSWFAVAALGAVTPSVSWRLLTGTYQYQYRKSSTHTWRDGVLTPENTPTVIGTFEITPTSSAIQLNVEAATVSFAARLNGQPAPANLPTTEQGFLSIRHRGATDWTDIGTVGGQMIGPNWRLITGTYDVRYRASSQHTWRDGILTPENKETVFTNVEIRASGGEIQIPLETATVTFQARVNGQPSPQNLAETELGILAIKHQGSTTWIDIGTVGGQMIGPNWRLITGTYDVQYRRSPQHVWREGVITPENEATTTGTIVIPAAGGVVPVPIKAATVTFEARINGQPAPTNLPDSELGTLDLRHEGATKWISVGALGRGMIGPDWRLLTGTYDLRYTRSNQYEWRDGILTPENPATVVGQVTIPENGGPVTLNISAASTEFATRLNGQPAPAGLPSTEQGEVTIRHRGQSEAIGVDILGSPQSYKWRLLTGDYVVRYDRLNTYNWREGILTPENPDTVTGCFKLVAP